ncbi:MAG: hypothetical protein ACXWU1_00740 [Allosphingosinicella sp.]
MSHIPTSAMPHAGPQVAEETAESSRFGRVAEIVREHPKTAVAAGAAFAAGLVAAAAIPAIRSRSRGPGQA